MKHTAENTDYSNIQRVAGIALAKGEAVVFGPTESGGFDSVAMLMPEVWIDLQERLNNAN